MIQHKDFGLCMIPEQWNVEDAVIHDGNIYCGASSIRVSLPPGNWEIVGLASSLTEYQWKGIVEIENKNFYNVFPDFMNNVFYGVCNTATNSGASLLTHHGLKPETTLIILNSKA